MKEADILRAKTDFLFFCEKLNLVSLSRDIVSLCQMMSSNSRLKWIEEYHPTYSRIISIAYPVWRLGNNHQLRITLVTDSHKSAHSNLSFIKDLINDNTVVNDVFPKLSIDVHKRGSLTVDRPFLVPDSSIKSIGAFDPLFGRRADVIISDNIVTNGKTLLSFQSWFELQMLCHLVIGGECVLAGKGIKAVGTEWVQLSNNNLEV